LGGWKLETATPREEEGVPPFRVYDPRPGRRRGVRRMQCGPGSGPKVNATASGRRKMPPPCFRAPREEERKP